jgi:hypothetical protein
MGQDVLLNARVSGGARRIGIVSTASVKFGNKVGPGAVGGKTLAFD